ncbi:MAG: hypothetical protein M3Y71_06225 [Actinomycetota bacterium]|nr:hypothetical protein [Actinomycetota bacterium]
MREAEGGGLTFAVVLEQLGEAGRGVRAVTQVAQTGAVEALPQGLSLGHDRLTAVLHDFCGRWDRGLSLLVDDSIAMADALESTAADYGRRDDEMQLRYLSAPRG